MDASSGPVRPSEGREEHEHSYEFGSYACLGCGAVDDCHQMTFADAVPMEMQSGDPEYTAWLASGRPRVSGGREDVLPGL